MIRNVSQLGREPEWDLLIIGGGINGAGIAREAALRDLKVALIDQGDWGSGASSRSSRLVHGGLRYLEHGQFGLVREALREREILLHIAPHLVAPLRMLAPVWGDSPHGLTTMSLGVGLYDLLAGRQRLVRRERLGAAEVCEREGLLRRNRLHGAIRFADAHCDDARLVLANVRSAVREGATCASYVRVDRLNVEDGRVRGARLTDMLGGGQAELRARLVVNATGAWSDHTARLAGGPDPARRVRPTRGAHVIVRRLSRDALILPSSDGRVLFAIPIGAYSLLGTTDTDHSGSLDDVAATRSDVGFILAEAARALPRAGLDERSVIATYAALRPLVADGGVPGRVTREHRIEEGPPGLVHLVGGKLTTFRAVAAQLVDKALRLLGLPPVPSRSAELTLDGADTPDFPVFRAGAARELEGRFGLPPAHAERLVGTYGTRVSEVAELLKAHPELLSRLCPEHPHLAVEAAYAMQAEMAVHLSDFLFRRTRIAHSACRGQDCAVACAEAMGMMAGWDPARTGEEVNAYLAESARLTSPAGRA